MSGKYVVEFELPDGTKSPVEAGAEEYILDAGRRAGLELPSVCEQGWCISCAARILEGKVDQSDSRRYYDQDREAWFALICTGKPRSNLRLKTHQSSAMREHRDKLGLPAPRGT